MAVLLTVRAHDSLYNFRAHTMDFNANDVGFVPAVAGHYVENTGNTDLVFLEMSSERVYDFSLNNWLRRLPPEAVTSHLNLDADTISKIPAEALDVLLDSHVAKPFNKDCRPVLRFDSSRTQRDRRIGDVESQLIGARLRVVISMRTHTSLLLVLFLGISMLPDPAHAQTNPNSNPAPAHCGRPRFSVLAISYRQTRRDFAYWLHIGGEYRDRVEANRYRLQGTSDVYLLDRFRLKVAIQPKEWLKFYGKYRTLVSFQSPHRQR